VGAVLLAILLLLVYGYWYRTNDRRVRDEAEEYLEQLTGGPVDIHRGHFSFFGGIELSKVRLYLPGRGRSGPFFRAAKVVMRHHPWQLTVAGKLQPTHIVCVAPTVTLEYDADAGTYNLKEFFELVRRKRAELAGKLDKRFELPSIRVQEGRLRVVDVVAGRRQQLAEVPVEIMMRPTGLVYEIELEESGEAPATVLQGKVLIDLESGQITQIVGRLPLESLEKTLPMRYRRWSRRYKLAGDIHLTRNGAADDGSVLSAQLEGVRMQLPEQQGGLHLDGVRGKMLFRPEGVTLEGISGRIPQAGNCLVQMDGEYLGYAETAPFEVSINILGLSLPEGGTLTGPVAQAVDSIRGSYQPEGAIDLTVHLRRGEDGQATYEGSARPQAMAMLFEHFPYRVQDVRGEIAFKPGLVELKGLTARRGDARCEITGKLTRRDEKTYYDLKVNAKDLLLDEDLRMAIPEQFQPVWEALDPVGRTGMNAHVYRLSEEQDQQIELHIAMDGKGSIRYTGFPFRIEQLRGDAYIEGRNARIDNVFAVRGGASCKIDGVLKAIGTDNTDVELSVIGKNLPLDKPLADASGSLGVRSFDWLAPTGLAEKFSARVWKKPGRQLDYRVVADLANVTVTPAEFPYRIESITGLATIRPGVFALENARGKRGDMTVRASGKAYLSDQDVRLDVSLSAQNVNIAVDLKEALPPDLAKVWKRLSPAGLADMSLELKHNLPGAPSRTDYRFVLDAKDMSITYSDFPYPLKGISGRVVASPGKVMLEKLFTKSGQMRGQLEGAFTYSHKSDQAEISLSAVNVPMDEDLLDAIPDEFGPLARSFEAVGTCDVDLKRLNLYRPRVRVGEPLADNSMLAAAPAMWNVDGSIMLRNALVNVGMGAKKMTGLIQGSGRRSKDGLSVDAALAMTEVVSGSHSVQDLRGKLVKGASAETMKVENFSAKLHGGKVAGFAELDMSEPLRYRLNLLIDGVDLAKVFAAGGSFAGEQASGLLEGRIELSETAGRPESRRASGVLRLNESKLYGKVPVLLDLLTVVYLSVPGEATFTEGECLYHLKGDILTLREVYLRGPTLSLVGSGTVSVVDKKLNLHFLTGPPGKLPRLSGLADEVLTGILRELMEIEVTGTLHKPRTRTRTLASLEETILRLLRPTASQ